MKFGWIFAAPFGAAIFTAAAAEPPAELEPVVVTATRVGQSAFEVPASIDRISADEINANKFGVNLSEDLSGIPGVLVRDRQNYAQDQQISIRGFGTRAPFGIIGIRLYVDGVPATMPDGQGQVSHFNLDSAERIEVLRGPFSALYGNAAGGVIQIFTAPATDPLQLEVEAAGGSYGARRESLNARGIAGPLNYNADYTHFQTDGYRDHSAARRESGNARLAFDAGANTKITLLANTVAIPEAQDPLGLTRTQFDANPRQATPTATQFNTRKSVRQTQTGLTVEQVFGHGQSLLLTSYYGKRAVKQFLAIPMAPQQNSEFHSGGVVDLQTSYTGADLHWTSRSDLLARPLTVVGGLTYDLQRGHRRGYENFISTDLGVQGNLRRDENDDVYNFDQYGQADWDWSERWSAMAGVRHSAVHFRSKDHYIVGANQDDSGGVNFNATTPVAGMMFRATERLHLHASYGRGFDTPTFNELAYRPDGNSGLNTDLRAAHSDSAELGAKWRPTKSSTVNAAMFYAGTHDEIVVDTAQGGRQTFQNAGRTRREGAEFEMSTAFTDRLRAQLAYTWIEATFRDPFVTCPGTSCPPAAPVTVSAGNRIPGVPRSNLYGALHWGIDTGWNAALEGNYLSRVAVDSANSQSAPAYALFGVNGGYVWNLAHWRLRAFLRLDNALDRHYVGSVIVNDTNSRFYEPGPGRSVLGGIDLRFNG